MNLLLDTNILLYAARFQQPHSFIAYINPTSAELYTSVVSLAEAKSIIWQNGWATGKIRRFDAIIDQISVIEVTDYLVSTYVQIDAYSQRRNPNFQQYPFTTPRNMGKNDLWIAATASLLQLQLVTTDADFQHLHDSFLQVRYVAPSAIRTLLSS